MTILVTGGRGAVARGLTGLLDRHGVEYRPASRRPDTPGTVHCDLADPACFPAALRGVSSVFLYAEAGGIDAFVKEAVAAGVEHVVLLSSSSVLAPDAADSPIAASHLAVEEALLASPLRTTLLRPGSFASNARGWAWPIKSGSPVRLPYPGAYADPVHEADLSEAAFAALTDPALAGRAYTLTGPHALTFTTQLSILGGVLERPIPVETVSPEQWKTDVAEYVPGPYAEALLDFWSASDGLPVPVTGDVELLTGHPARSFRTWCEDHAADFTG
ncbi:NAD(P)H-binding protein [Streptomyces sp. NPDC048603]|uniref:NAD(P)H-binding protein n=1 Tax=Streptomyces sp. NPDC048603 TaxID=3365577 RepID=UPI003722B083